MPRHRTVLLVTLTLVGVGVGFAGAQIVVTDPGTTIKNAAIAALKDQVLDVLTEQGRTIRRMARRLSVSTRLEKYAANEPPRWRVYRLQDANQYANPYNEALNGGDRDGTAYAEIARARSTPGLELAALAERAPSAEAAIAAQLATLDLADSTIIAGTDQNGRLRASGKREMRAIDALERDVIDPSQTQSATAVLDKISGAVLIEARQKQARLGFLSALVEQLLVDNKRARDTEAAAMNMQLGRLRGGPDEGGGFLTGAGNDLRTWKQP